MTKRCVNGHYYDGDKFARCPYCGAGDMDENVGEPTVPAYNVDRQTSQASPSNVSDDEPTVMLEESQNMNSPVSSGNMQTETANDLFPAQSASYDGDATKSIPLSKISGSLFNNDKETKTSEPENTSANSGNGYQSGASQFTGTQQNSASQFTGTQQNSAPQFTGTQQSGVSQFSAAQDPTFKNNSSSSKNDIRQMVQEAKSTGSAFDDGDAPTQRLTNPILDDEPTVGWLIGVNGNYYGECFELKSGKNFIGRAPEMDIVLSADKTVSRYRHAVVLYEPHSRVFIAQAGESRELFYLNENVVLKNEQLNAYDTLLIGTTKLVFFPLCGSEFSWDDLKEE